MDNGHYRGKGRLYLFGFLILVILAGVTSLIIVNLGPGKQPDRKPGQQPGQQPEQQPQTQTVRMETSLGAIRIELDAAKAPVTVENFLRYVDAGFYDGTLFHRVIPGFMIQGGGFTGGMRQKTPSAPIKNEAGNGLSNARGTIAMARTSAVDSATSQFFINVADNTSLDHKDNTAGGFGYCVFGRVIEGMDVVDKIVGVPTHTVGMYEDVPVEDVVIGSVKREE